MASLQSRREKPLDSLLDNDWFLSREGGVMHLASLQSRREKPLNGLVDNNRFFADSWECSITLHCKENSLIQHACTHRLWVIV